MKLRIHLQAIRELDKAIIWYGKKSLLATQRLQDEVTAVSHRILANPEVFPLVSPDRRRPSCASSIQDHL